MRKLINTLHRIPYVIHLQRTYADIRTVQAQLGHSDVRTTQIYTHVLQQGGTELLAHFHELGLTYVNPNLCVTYLQCVIQ